MCQLKRYLIVVIIMMVFSGDGEYWGGVTHRHEASLTTCPAQEMTEEEAVDGEMFSPELHLAFLNSSAHDPKPWDSITPNQHTFVGVYLIIVGVVGTLDNALVVAMFIKFPGLMTPSNLLLLNLCLTDLGMCLFAGFPFSGLSSLAGRWLYGDMGCQYYAFTGFLMGNANLNNHLMIALDRYLITCRNDLRGKMAYGRYYQMVAFIWLWSLFWAVCPLLGWASYGYEPSGTTCTINWQDNDAGYKWYIMTLLVLVYVVPLILMCSCYYQAARFLRHARDNGHAIYAYEWANENNVTRMGVVLVATFLCCWSGYAVVCVWTVFRHPYTVPVFLTLLPPLMAKAGPVLNPIIYFYSHPRLRKGMVAILTCCCREPPVELLEMPETKSIVEDK
ncbi:visual pigment-like receptor peropsin isoform X2 [Procambarus clarkii]|uniref:visual pigment-like receptor peropsin isoform X2 n=1 Tax=Procambarus clarkii TaxID=6728 RepID=UPI00374280BF